MNNQEAIETLKANYPDTCYEQLREAVDMAISALQAQDVPDINVGDMISRQKAIDALCSKCTVDKPETCSTIQEGDRWCEEVYTLLNLPSAQPEPSTEIQEILNYLDTTLHPIVSPDNWYVYAELYDMVSSLSSVQPEPHWTPVSERMPEDGENCLVSVRCPNDFLVDRGTYSIDLFKVDEEHFFGKRGESGWYHLSSEYGYCKILNVIAWMPEPRPYKEIKDEGFN